jgi:hypothetical protein
MSKVKSAIEKHAKCGIARYQSLKGQIPRQNECRMWYSAISKVNVIVEKHAVLGIVQKEAPGLPMRLFQNISQPSSTSGGRRSEKVMRTSIMPNCQYHSELYYSTTISAGARHGIPWETFEGLRKMQGSETKGESEMWRATLYRNCDLTSDIVRSSKKRLRPVYQSQCALLGIPGY